MDANGLRFWMLADARHFAFSSHAVWDARCKVLRLASERTLTPMLAQANAFAAAQAALENTPRAVDALECVASWDAARTSVVVKSYLPDEALLLSLEDTPRDLCAGDDGVLYIALPGRVRMHDLRSRWVDVNVSLPGFEPWRMAPIAGGGVWVMERTSGRLARLSGRPQRAQTPQSDDYDARVFRPTPENGCAPLLSLAATPAWGDNERPLALAAGPDGSLVVLTWIDGDATAAARRWLDNESRLSAPLRLQGANYAYAVTWIAPDRIALRIPGRRDAPAFDLASADASGAVMPLGDIYPLSETAREAPFANGAVQPPQYPSGERGSEPLYPLSLNNLARRGEAHTFAGSGDKFTAWLIDSHDNTTVWHRLYVEAAIPAHTGFVVWLAATNDPRPPASGELAAWHPHGFGRDIAALDDAMRAPHVPRAAWEHDASELPGHGGLLGGDRQAGWRGLFSVLVQNSRERVRKLTGRYLWVRIVLHGDGRVGPEIAALRAWASRFSYADRYLPRLYRESLFGDAASAPGERVARIEMAHAVALDTGGPVSDVLRARLARAEIPTGPTAAIVVERADDVWLLQDASSAWRLAVERNDIGDRDGIGIYRPQSSPADFTARMLSNFEGVLTQMEDRVAAAHLLTDPVSVPEDNLDWLAGWIGVAFDNALPVDRRREWLRAAPDLARRHGTRDGLRLALDVATGGGVRGGEIVVIESFRLRRILATLLGVDLADETDPLLPGLQQSGNSVVGDTLVVGDAERIELLALFRGEVASEAESVAVTSFYERLAHRATVLVHREVVPQDFTLIRRIVQLETPAHVEVRVVAATWPLLVGIASLVGVDTYLGPPRLPRPVQVERSALGMGDFLIGIATLDPRLSGAPSATPPVADAGPDRSVAVGSSFILDGSASRAAPGHTIAKYGWRWSPPADR
jgi:phage tail-like protein